MRPAPPLTLSGQAKTFDALAMYAFVVLGLPDGMIGTAWPAVRGGFHAPLEDLGIVLLVSTFGAIASSSVAGVLLGRLGIRRMIMLAGSIAALGAVGIIVSPVLWAFVLSGTGIGVAAGFLDSSVNTAVALANRNRLLNMLHGSYGIGYDDRAAGHNRRPPGRVLAAGLRGAPGRRTGDGRGLVAGRPAARGPGGRGDADGGRPRTAGRASRAGRDVSPPGGPGTALSRSRLVVTVALGLVVFMVYTGFEVSAGQWEPSFDRGPLHMGTGPTGLATFGYWGALTLARFALAAPRRPLSQAGIVRWGCIVALGGAALVWWRPSERCRPRGPGGHRRRSGRHLPRPGRPHPVPGGRGNGPPRDRLADRCGQYRRLGHLRGVRALFSSTTV